MLKTTVKVAAASLLTGAAMTASVASAADYQLTDVQKREVVALLTAPKASPGIGISVPTGFGASSGTIFASIGGTTTDNDNTDDLDGSMSIGMGIGDATEALALEVQANIISLTNNADGSDVGEEGSVSIKLSRNIGSTSAISVGAENITTWGEATGDDVDASGYIAFTNLQALSDNPSNPLTLGITIGVGSERFAFADTNTFGVFGAVSLAVHRQIGLIADHNGKFANLGVSLVPVRSLPLTVSLSAVNVNQVSAAKGGTSTGETEFGGSVGYSWNF